MKLVFVHGAGSSSLSFYYQLRHFRNSKAIDLPGHPNGKPCPDINGYLEWVRGFNTARRYKDVVLCGHGMGGAITLLYALKYPEELRGIILLDTGAKLKVSEDMLKLCEQPGENNSQWLKAHETMYNKVDSDIYQVLMRRAEEIGPATELKDLRSCADFDVASQISQVNLPTQIICGADDAVTPVKQSERLAEQIKGARKHIIPEAGHFAQLEKYQEVNEQIESFLYSLK